MKQRDGDRLERLIELSPIKRALLLKKFAQQVQGSPSVPAIMPRRQPGPAILSFAQQQLFFLYLLDPDNPVYNIPIGFRLIGMLDVSVLVESLNTIIQRHEILRTTISLSDGELGQVVAPTFILTPQIIDLCTYPQADQVDAIDRIVDAEFSAPFDLTRGPLIRVTLLRLGDREHVFLLNMHHIIADGWSVGLLMQEFNALYSAIVQGRSCPLAALPVQYADYAIWQRQWLQGAVLADLLAYWRKHLADAPTLIDLPTDHPRPGVQRYRGSTFSFRVAEEVRTALHRLGQAEGVTLFMTLLAAFQVLLYRYSGQEDFLVGTPIANRTREETERLIGCFINTLVLRSNLAGNPPFRTLLQRVREVCLEAYAHQELPIEQLVEALQPERNSSYNPLFQVMFVLQNAPDTALDLPGLRVQPVEEQGQNAKFDLTLLMTESEQALEGTLEYNSDLFDRSTMERLSGHLLIILQGIVVAPDRRVADMALLTAEEEHYLLHEVNPSIPGSVPALCLHQFFEAQVERSPDAVAVVYGEESLTYRQLNRRADVLADRLRALGVGPDVLVAICVQRSLELVVGLLAILKAGGAYVPLDPTYPEERIAFILADTQAPVLVTQRPVRGCLAAYAGTVLWLAEITDRGEEREGSQPVPVVSPANLAYVIYTSGSTGRPKGVAITHASAAQLIAWAQKAYTAEELRRVLASTSICFDLSIFELFVPLSTGGSSILVEHALQPEIHAGIGAVTLVNTVPSVAREMLRLGGFSTTVQTINLAGEALPLELMQDLYEQTSASRVFNLYGPSEDTTYSTYALLPATTTEAPTIGRPIGGTRVYVLDQRLCLVAVGMPGEIYIGGDGLARGYLNRPDLTAERFVPDPFVGAGQAQDLPLSPALLGARLYKTGDLARYRADGNLEFLGRLDHQVKVRGFRIELGEIEMVLGSHPGVRERAVVVQNDETGAAHLVAYIIPQPGQEPGSDDLRGYLQAQLPSYMLPSAFILLDTFPLTTNGKIDRRALSALYQRNTVSSRKLIRGPRDIIELRLVQLWEKVLQTAPISISDNFFDLGGHSLLALRLVAQMQSQFGCSIPISALIQHGTIERIAHLIRLGSDAVHQSPLVLLQPAGATSPFFCIHPAGGSVLSYVELARYLERPFYGLQATCLYEGEVRQRSVEEMAAQYIAALQSVQPHGPYLLGGWSSGGVIAFEMARQLMAHGSAVSTLVLIDSFLAAHTTSSPEMSQLDMLIDFALQLGLSQEHLNAAQDRVSNLPWGEQWASIVGRMKDVGVIPAESDPKHLQRLFHAYQATMHAWLQYRPQRYEGSLTLLRASERMSSDDNDAAVAWRRVVAGDLTVIDIPGDHYSVMRQPHVLLLAEHLQHCLDAKFQTERIL